MALRMLSRRVRPAALRVISRPQHRSLSVYGYEQAKALTFENYGEPSDVMTLHTHSISPSHGDQVTLKFLASPINPADINQIQGVYPSKPTFTTSLGTATPIAVGGNEGVAEVISVGDKVKNLQRGDWVIQRSPGFGTWRTHAQTTAEGLLKIENKQGITPIQAGTISVNPCTAYQMLKGFGLQEGNWFIQNGANSGVGRAAIQLGKLWGYKSINVVRARAEGMDALKADLTSLGADVVITDEELASREIKDRIAEWTNGGRSKIQVGLNCVGGKPATNMAKVLSSGAHLVTYGAMSKQPVMLPAGLLIFKDLHFDGFWVSRFSDKNPEAKQKMVEHVLDLYREGNFKDTPVDEVKWTWDTPAEELKNAVQGTLEGYRSGKGVFVFEKT